MELTFLGAAGTVTGSKYLVRAGKKTILVDCGLYQGQKELRLRNREPLPIDPRSIDAVLLTHAHVDHSGHLPLLVRQGFAGPIYASSSTAALCNILLPDSAKLQEEEAEYANQHTFSKHHPALPLYTAADAQAALGHFMPVEFDAPTEIGDGLRFTLLPAGHILGASMIRLESREGSVLFSGDLGRLHDPIMSPPRTVEEVDYLVVESTYGGRDHVQNNVGESLAEVVNRTANRGGIVVVPAFCVGRAQELLHLLAQLKATGRIPNTLPIFLNSPMAADTTELYVRYRAQHRLSPEACSAMAHVATIINSVEQSRALNTRPGPMVVIAGSGMATGGRVVHHLKAWAPDPRNTILLAGFQAQGTRGASLESGASEVKIHGNMVPVRAEVVKLDGLSAHADSTEIRTWMRGFKRPPRTTFVTHGEPAQSAALAKRVGEELGWSAVVPRYLEKVRLFEGAS